MRLEIRAHLLEGAGHPRLHVHRVQVVQQQQVGDQLVPCESLEKVGAGRAPVPLHDGEHAPETLTVERQQTLHDVGHLATHGRIGQGVDLVKQRLYPRGPLCQLAVFPKHR